MSGTRPTRSKMAPTPKKEDLISKIASSSMSKETKEILKLFLALFSSLQTDKDPKVAELDEKFLELENRHVLLTNRVEELMSAKEESSKRISDLESKLSSVERSNDELNSKILTMEQSNDNLVSQVTDIEQTNLNLAAKVSTAEQNRNDELRKLQINLDSTNQYERRDTLVISGPDLPMHSEDENPKTLIQSLLRSGIRYNLDPSSISIAHRIGRKPARGEDRRNLIFKLCRRDLVPEIISACKTNKPSFFINPSLTPLRSKILYVLRQLKKKYPEKVKGCLSTLNGDVTVYVADANGTNRESSSPSPSLSTSSRPKDQRFIVNTKGDLLKFVNERLRTTLDGIQIDW